MLASFAATAAHIASLLAQPLLVARLVREATSGHLANADILPVLSALVAAMLTSALFARLQAHYGNLILQDMRHGAKGALYAHFLARPAAYFRDRNEGWIEASVANASMAARSIVYEGVTALARIVLFVLICGALLLATEAAFGFAFLGTAGIFLVYSYRLARMAALQVGAAVASTVEAAGRATDLLVNLEQVQLANRTSPERHTLFGYLDAERSAYAIAQARIDRSEFLQRLYMIGLFSLFVLTVAWVADGDPAAAIQFYVIGLIAFGQLDATGKTLNTLFEMSQKLAAVLDAVEFDTAPAATPEDCRPSVPPNPAGLRVVLNDVRFSYPGNGPILHGLTLAIAPGSHVTIVGRSGIGKSTLLQLIAGLALPDSGSVTLDDVATERLTQGERAAYLSFVSQNATLFDRSLLENTTYGCASVPAEQVEHVLLALGLGTLKTRGGPAWLGQRIDKNGLGLSGGERQRVLLARAILRRRPLMLLDEATSALDTDSERQVLSSLHELCRQATIIAVTHHPHSAMAGYRVIDIGAA